MPGAFNMSSDVVERVGNITYLGLESTKLLTDLSVFILNMEDYLHERGDANGNTLQRVANELVQRADQLSGSYLALVEQVPETPIPGHVVNEFHQLIGGSTYPRPLYDLMANIQPDQRLLAQAAGMSLDFLRQALDALQEGWQNGQHRERAFEQLILAHGETWRTAAAISFLSRFQELGLGAGEPLA